MPLTKYHYDSLFSTLKRIKNTCFKYVDVGYFDVRLRYFEGDYTIIWGDSQYDLDHRGFWGYHTVFAECSDSDLKEIILEMYKEIEDQMHD